MKKNKNPYQVFDRYCLRTPLFSFSLYKNWIDKEKLRDADYLKIVRNPIVKEAIFLASPELYSQLQKWETGALTNLQKIERLQYAVLKYVTRITTRCTPFGLFASCAIGRFSKESNLRLKKSDAYKRHTRFDMTFLAAVVQQLIEEKPIRNAILFYPNTSLYQIGDHYRYVEYTLKHKKRDYTLEGIVYSEYLEKTIQKAHQGKTICQLAELLNEETSIEEATRFVEMLIDHQILISELELTVTGNDYFDALVTRIQQIPEVAEISHQLIQLQSQLKALDITFGNPVQSYKDVIDSTGQITEAFDKKYLFQTDCFTATYQNTLNHSLKWKLKKVMALFNKMTLPSANPNIEEFKKAFLKRYEQEEVPLNLVLDTETGIGYGSKKDDANPLLDNLFSKGDKKRYQHIVWRDIDYLLQDKLADAFKNNNYTVILTEEDVEEFSINWTDLPDTLSAITEIYNKEKIYIKNIGGASAINLLGRFSQGDNEILDYVRQIAKTEETINSDKVLAEIVHLPEARTGNVLQRASIRKHEIPYLCKSNVGSNYQIPIDDLVVSIKGDKVVLKSIKLNKEVLPRLGNAHNFGANSLPIYEFLCDLQTQNVRPAIGYKWNSVFLNQSFLPRVEFEGIIFSKARWNISVQEFKDIMIGTNKRVNIKEWQQKLKLPKFVELIDGDNRLLINLENKSSVNMLFHTIKNRTQFILEEFLFSTKSIVKGENGSYCNQFVISFYNEEKLKLAENEN